ncbi:uncharacterized protein LOC134697976 [Mytilus trossulus]|uniref:uncharacterized protein LOC134697976 n=1 Tax=Mytilus trossulus TaxID=6551 RepID=UPI0030052947
MAPISEEEENYVRLALLLKGVSPTAVRTYFDKEFPPTYLPSTLNKNYNTLLDLKLKRILNQAQWNLLIPRNGVPDSKTFDVTLMISLIRNLTSVVPPINGFDSLPLPGETTPGSDLARIKYYRNKLAHHDSNTIDTGYFNAAWSDISDNNFLKAVGRLGGQTTNKECQDLKVKILDQSNQEIILEIQQSLEEMKELRQTMDNLGTNHSLVTENLRMLQDSHNTLQTSHSTLQTEHSKAMENMRELKDSQCTLQAEHSKVTENLKDPIPRNIRDQMEKQLEDWEKKDKMFVSTRASDYVFKSLHENSCVTLTGPAGVGKSFISRHIALLLRKKGYKIMPVYSPIDIRMYYQPGKQTVFFVDDMCGNFTANQQQIENWEQLLPVIKTIIADKCCKIIVSCRLQVYKDDKFKVLSPFKSCECNLISDKLCLTSAEKSNIARTYIGTSLKDIDDLSQTSDFFPLLCSLFDKTKDPYIKKFFTKPFDVYKNELDNLGLHGDGGNLKICSLALCVIFNNHLEEKWFKGNVTVKQRRIIEDTCDACEIDRNTSKAKLKKALDTLEGTFICKQNGLYRTIHDTLFDFIAHYLSKKMIECLIEHGDSYLVHERFIWEKTPDDTISNMDFIIEIPHDHLESYLKRFLSDWSKGKVGVIFRTNNMKISLFRQQLLQHLTQLDKSQQEALANTKDTVIPKEHHGSGTTPLIILCLEGYTDIVQWVLHNDVDVDQFRDDGMTGLLLASQEGHTDIVRLLLEKNPNVDLCNSNFCSPLYMASMKGNTNIVRLLLENNSYVDLFDINGWSPLYMACWDGHTDIVKLLLERHPNVDLCDNDGRSPLLLASNNGHTNIVKLLLKKNPNVDLCDSDGCSPLYLASQNGKTEIVRLLLEKNPLVDLCDNYGSGLLCTGQHWKGILM